jgi:hypothetical protein
MRKRQSYLKKYGQVNGEVLYRTLQREAAQARWKAFYRDRKELLMQQFWEGQNAADRSNRRRHSSQTPRNDAS